MKKWFTLCFLLAATGSFAKTIYVNKSATGANNGTSWTDAFKFLQDALAAAASGDEIWVARGAYYPDEGANITKNDRYASFAMKNGVAIYAGFAGGETNLSARNWKTSKVLLSGRIGITGNKSEYSMHVISNTNLDNTAKLDGFTITLGNANDFPLLSGGGMVNSNSSPEIVNCTFLSNEASADGGAMYNLSYSSPKIVNCVFAANTSGNRGGGIFNLYGSPVLINCTFSKNTSNFGGGMYNGESSPTIFNSIFWGNTASVEGDQLEDINSTTTVTYSIVQGAYAGTGNLNEDPLFVNAANNDLHLQACSPAINAGTTDNAPPNDVDGAPRPALGKFDIGAYEFQPISNGSIVYVNAASTGSNDGTSWANAFTKLQDALTKARTCHNISQIWVANGTYYPDEGVGFNNNDYEATFSLMSNVALYGGFTGTETQLSQRNLKNNATILSGDINQTGAAPDEVTNSANVVTCNYIDSTAIIDGFSVEKGYGVPNAGGLICQFASPTIINCQFKNNYSINLGGGIGSFESSPRIINCTFQNNHAYEGAGIVQSAGNAIVINCSFSGNNTEAYGNAISNLGSIKIANCIMWDNDVADHHSEIQNYDPRVFHTDLIISNSIVQGGYDGTNILNQDPLFVDTAKGNLHLQACSPAINAGTSDNAPSNDLDRNPRPALGGYDMGAYEFQPISNGSIVYVNAAATGTNDGTSWANAFTKLQDALTQTKTCHNLTQIWVAKGIYYPDEGVGYNDNYGGYSFGLQNGVSIYGGFAGSETQLSQRNWKNNVTILSGDIQQDDDPATDNPNNAAHVLYSDGVDSSAVVDGFTITKGWAENNTNYVHGGGIVCLNSSPVISNCRFIYNHCFDEGGAFFNLNSSPHIINCSFSSNSAGGDGGAISNYNNSAPVITNCSFSGNYGEQGGRAIINFYANAVITNCIFWGDKAANSSSPEILDYEGTNTVVSNCIVQDGYNGTNIINKDPMFVNAANNDLHIQACSPAIDSGLNNANNTSFDLDNNARINHNTIDIGAYEYSGTLYNFYVDADGDGYGSTTLKRTSFCPTTATGESTNNTDCNDTDASFHSPQTYYIDADKDGYGSTATAQICSSTAPAGYSNNNTDCNDNNAAINPNTVWVLDADGDGYYTGNAVTQCISPGVGYVIETNQTAGDCNDNDASVHQSKLYYVDADKDGYGSTTTAMLCSSTAPPGYSTNNTDCNDKDANVHSPQTYYVDADKDGYGSTTIAMLCASAAPVGYSTNNTDCNDKNANIHPGAKELCDGLDNDCDGQIDEDFYLISICDASIKEGDKGQKYLCFTVSLNKKAPRTITVNYTTQNGTATAGSDYVAQSGTLTFAANVQSKTISILINGDKTVEPNETFKIVLSNAFNATISRSSATGTILNDDCNNSSAVADKLITEKSVKLSPVPAQTILNVQLTGYTGNVTLQLYNAAGKALQQVKINASKITQHQINVAGYAAGVYFLAIIDEENNRRTEKVVIAK